VVTLSVLFPRMRGQSPPEIRNLVSGHANGLVLDTPQFNDVVLLSGATAPVEGVRATDFEWAWLRRYRSSRMLERALLLHGTHFLGDDVEVKADRQVKYVAIVLRDGKLLIDVVPAVGIHILAPRNVDHIVINGGARLENANRMLFVAEGDIPSLTMPRDPFELCSYVRR
jgi:hypothetical protein